MSDNQALIVIILIVVFGLIAIAPLFKNHIACKPKRNRVLRIQKATFKKWVPIKHLRQSSDLEELIKLSKLSRTTVYRCLHLYEFGSSKQISDFENGKQSVSSLVKEIDSERIWRKK